MSYTIRYAYRSTKNPNHYLLIMDDYENSVLIDVEYADGTAKVTDVTTHDNDSTQLESGLWIDYTSGDDLQEIETNQVPLNVQHVAVMETNR